MSTFDRMELIEEIEVLAIDLGVTDMSVLDRLTSLDDSQLLNLRDALQERLDEAAAHAGVPA